MYPQVNKENEVKEEEKAEMILPSKEDLTSVEVRIICFIIFVYVTVFFGILFKNGIEGTAEFSTFETIWLSLPLIIPFLIIVLSFIFIPLFMVLKIPCPKFLRPFI